MKRTSTLVLVMALVIALIPVPSYAQSTTDEPTTTDATTSTTADACALAKKRVAAHATAISALQTDHSAKYATMKARVNTLLATATRAKYTDVTSLTAARDTITTALSAYNAQAKVYEASLEVTQAAPCGEEAGEFTPALTISRAELVTLRNTALAVKASFKQTTVPALRDYANWLKATANTTQENS